MIVSCRWNVNVSTDCCSEEVEIIFSALHSTISEIGEKAFRWQERDVMSHIIEIWLNLLNSMLREAEWTKDDGFTSQGLAGTVKPILHHPIHLHLI
nr:ent-kaur-16-ene synthase, chloroplastic [Ipomoea batatas]